LQVHIGLQIVPKTNLQQCMHVSACKTRKVSSSEN